MNDELQEKLRSIEHSLENAVLQLDRTNEELIIYKTEGSFGNSAVTEMASEAIVRKRDVEAQTEEGIDFPGAAQLQYHAKKCSLELASRKPDLRKDLFSPTASLWNELLMSPSTTSHKIPRRNNDFNILVASKVNQEMPVGGSSPNLHKFKYAQIGSPTPLKTFLNENLTKIRKLKTANNRFEMKSKMDISTSKMSMRSSRAPSGSKALGNSKVSDSGGYSALYSEIVANKKMASRSRKKNSSRAGQKKTDQTNIMPPKQTGFSQHFLETKAKVYHSSIELPGGSFSSKLASFQDKSKHKFKMLNGNVETSSDKKDPFEIFRERLKKTPSAINHT